MPIKVRSQKMLMRKRNNKKMFRDINKPKSTVEYRGKSRKYVSVPRLMELTVCAKAGLSCAL